MMTVRKAPDRFVTKTNGILVVCKILCAVCSLVYLEGQSLKTQVAIFMLSDMVLVTHGAAAGNIAFMSTVTPHQHLAQLA